MHHSHCQSPSRSRQIHWFQSGMPLHQFKQRRQPGSWVHHRSPTTNYRLIDSPKGDRHQNCLGCTCRWLSVPGESRHRGTCNPTVCRKIASRSNSASCDNAVTNDSVATTFKDECIRCSAQTRLQGASKTVCHPPWRCLRRAGLRSLGPC